MPFPKHRRICVVHAGGPPWTIALRARRDPCALRGPLVEVSNNASCFAAFANGRLQNCFPSPIGHLQSPCLAKGQATHKQRKVVQAHRNPRVAEGRVELHGQRQDVVMPCNRLR